MRILFYEELTDNQFWDNATPEEELALQTLEEGIYQRIKVLEPQIEEEEQKIEDAAVVIYLHKMAVQVKNFSPELTIKIESCLDPASVNIILLNVQQALQRFLN